VPTCSITFPSTIIFALTGSTSVTLVPVEKIFKLYFAEWLRASQENILLHGLTNDVSDYINLLVRIAHIICNHPLFIHIELITNSPQLTVFVPITVTLGDTVYLLSGLCCPHLWVQLLTTYRLTPASLSRYRESWRHMRAWKKIKGLK
jgi:hypothetical protein